MVKVGSEEVAAKIVHKDSRRATTTLLVEGQVAGNAKACSATVVLKLQNGRTQTLKVLISNRGRIQELVRTPVAVQAIHLTVDHDGNHIKVMFLRYRRLSTAEYRLRQLWRVGNTLYKQPLRRCARAGLTLTSLFHDLDHAYEIACRFRANVYREGYVGWYQEFYAVTSADRELMVRHAKRWQNSPIFNISLWVSRQTTQADIEATRASLRAQTYQCFDVEVWSDLSDDLSRLISASTVQDDAWRVVIRAGTTLSEQALFCLADAVIEEPDAAVIYADHDVMGAGGQLCDPVFKPDWSLELLRSTNYIGEAFAWNGRHSHRLEVCRDEVSDASAMHALLLALSELGLPMQHLHAPLWHMAADGAPVDGAETARVVMAHLWRMGVSAKVEGIGSGRCRVRYPVPVSVPLVSIIIPTRDGLQHLRCCIDSLFEKTRYDAYEILVVDNQSSDPETLAYLCDLPRRGNVRVLSFDEPFNYSRINNMAVAEANGDLVCLLNNDTEVISPDWLTEMVGMLLSGSVGAVGAKLLYGDGTVQHAGDTVGPGGCANHLHSGIGRDEPGYAGRALVAQDLSAVTAACLLTKRSVYESVGGLNENQLKVAFNDVDYCLRVRETGLRVVWTPHALLYHHESVTRGKDEEPKQRRRFRREVNYMRRRWAHVMQHDPYYNPNLNYLQANFALSATPGVSRPWSSRRSGF
ncbi:glycosyltransferase family 2 protein [Burkholderia anthina]|uniref:glycosyltransferase family 2 protein n=1 Tax=Burkholderia anthina TaxID=179879 RepID=UPI00158EE3E7|nr:glycosyltransferase family 2 protein [Burkholderia anthina]MBY4867908.1 glycosyltransferase family 2 protein [Burkholderia anthina]